MVFALRNLGLCLAAFAAWPLCARMACAVSFFLLLFAVSLTSHPAVLWLLGLYSVTGSVWLMLAYWSKHQQCTTFADGAVVDVPPGQHRVPWAATFIVMSVVGCTLAVFAFGPQRAARVLAEWLPTSGGTGGYDPFARGGINDGDDEVRGNNPRSIGTLETDEFLDSPLASLYDIADDLYGEPFKSKEQERAIALGGQMKFREGDKPPPESRRPNRDFSTTRKGPEHPRDPSNRTARALFEVEGRTPLHVRVTAFDSFDGVRWQEAPLNLSACLVDKERGGCWMKVREHEPAPIFAENEGHKFKIASPFGSLVPAPPYLVRFRVGRVDEADFFAWGQDHILRMAQRKTPSGIIVETESRTVDPRKLGEVKFPSGCPSDRLQYVALPANLDADVLALAHDWADGQPRGWPQIAAVVQHLRSEYVHDPTAHTPESCEDPLANFLLDARCGPDYQFASAAAVLLRALGYPTRLVSGFYVSPENYDPVTRHTPVVSEDLHFWAEVLLPSGEWLVIEPTPGNDVLGPSVPWTERALAALLAAGRWLWERILVAILCLVGFVVVCWKRIEVLDALMVMAVRLLPGQSWQRCVRRVLWLLERRARWAGRARPASLTPSAWFRAALGTASEPDNELCQFTLVADWCAYAPELSPPWSVPEVLRVCRRVVDAWSLRRWRSVVNGRGAGEKTCE